METKWPLRFARILALRWPTADIGCLSFAPFRLFGPGPKIKQFWRQTPGAAAPQLAQLAQPDLGVCAGDQADLHWHMPVAVTPNDLLMFSGLLVAAVAMLLMRGR